MSHHWSWPTAPERHPVLSSRFVLTNGESPAASKSATGFRRLISKAIVIRDLLTNAGDRVLEAGATSKVVSGKHAYDDIALLTLEDADVVADIRQKVTGFMRHVKTGHVLW